MGRARRDQGLSAPVPDELPVGEHGLALRRLRDDDVDALLAAVERSYPELHPWMPWAAELPTRKSLAEFVLRAGASGPGHEMAFGLFEVQGELVGSFGLHDRRGPGILEMGYWVRTDRSGRGYATAAARALTAAAFEHFPEVDRVEIHCDPDNLASAAVARKVGYRLETELDERQHLVWVAERG